MKDIKKILLIATTAAFIGGQFVWGTMYYFTGPFILALILIGLKEYSFKKVGLILSILIGYPFALLVLRYMFVSGWNELILSAVIVIDFIAVYVYLLRKLWTWFDPRLLTTMIVSLVFLSAFAILISYQVIPCYSISAAEKGVSVSEVQWCKMIGFYSEGAIWNSKIGLMFSGLYIVHSVLVYLPVLSAAVVLFASLLMNRSKSLSSAFRTIGPHRKN